VAKSSSFFHVFEGAGVVATQLFEVVDPDNLHTNFDSYEDLDLKPYALAQVKHALLALLMRTLEHTVCE